MNLPCCYQWESDLIRDEVVDCDNARLPGLPMCQKHMYWTFREAIIDGMLPDDVWLALAKETGHMMTVHKMAKRYRIDHAIHLDSRRREEEERARRESLTHVVYYVALTGDRIKIGTTAHLAQRMKDLRVRPQDVLAIEPGGRGLESDRHAQFAHLRIGKTEDFHASPDLEEHIRCIGFMPAS